MPEARMLTLADRTSVTAAISYTCLNAAGNPQEFFRGTMMKVSKTSSAEPYVRFKSGHPCDGAPYVAFSIFVPRDQASSFSFASEMHEAEFRFHCGDFAMYHKELTPSETASLGQRFTRSPIPSNVLAI